MTITGTIPNVIASLLKKENQSLNGIEIKGNDIDVVLVDNGIYTELYAIGMGNETFEIIELEDNLNLLPEYDSGDVISNDVLRKLFYTVIKSSLILSFNPLGEVKYGIKDKIENIKDVKRRIKDWVGNKLYAEDAEKFIRENGPYRRTFTDPRDGVTRTKKDYNAGRVNVGKIQEMNVGKGHYKVLSGNPATQDFQVWHLYKNGNKIRCVDLKTGLKAQEAKWVYDNNIPDSWSEADWNPEGEIPEKASKIEIGETEEQENQTEKSQAEETTEDNVKEGKVEQTEENDDLHEFVKDYYSGKGDFEVLEQSFDPFEEENVVDSDKKKKKTKSKYNGCNVTGCVEGDGSVVMASNNILEGASKPLILCSLILSKIKDFQNYIKKYKLQDKPKKVLTDILTRLVEIPTDDRNNMTKDSNNNVLLINFGNTDLTTENYIAQFEIYDDEVIAKVNLGKGNSLEGDDAIKMCIQTLDSIISQKQFQ